MVKHYVDSQLNDVKRDEAYYVVDMEKNRVIITETEAGKLRNVRKKKE